MANCYDMVDVRKQFKSLFLSGCETKVSRTRRDKKKVKILEFGEDFL
jgi:hypothetical protein